jgi:hypothetical protein
MRAALGKRARLVSVVPGGHGVYAVTPNVCANVDPDGVPGDRQLAGLGPVLPAETPAPPVTIRRLPQLRTDGRRILGRAPPASCNGGQVDAGR